MATCVPVLLRGFWRFSALTPAHVLAAEAAGAGIFMSNLFSYWSYFNNYWRGSLEAVSGSVYPPPVLPLSPVRTDCPWECIVGEAALRLSAVFLQTGKLLAKTKDRYNSFVPSALLFIQNLPNVTFPLLDGERLAPDWSGSFVGNVNI